MVLGGGDLHDDHMKNIYEILFSMMSGDNFSTVHNSKMIDHWFNFHHQVLFDNFGGNENGSEKPDESDIFEIVW